MISHSRASALPAAAALLLALMASPGSGRLHAHEAAHSGDAAAPFTLAAQAPVRSSAAALLAAEKTDQAASAGVLTAATSASAAETLTFTQPVIRLVVESGPPDDMLSYRIAGKRNPTLRLPAGAELHLLFVNRDDDMEHDLHFGSQLPPFESAPSMAGAAGSAALPPTSEGSYSSQELVVKALREGAFSYFCSVPGHARGGMWGFVLVGAATSPPPGSLVAAHGEEGGNGAMPGMAMPGMDMHGDMHSTIELNQPMSSESSGTSWVPSSSPLYARMKMHGKTMTMVHGVIFPRFTSIGGDRGVSAGGKGGRSRFDAPSMAMAMFSHPLGARAQLGVRVMASLDPLIERGYGYPLLYQSGETYRGAPLHDRQHPHELISELSATYSHKLGEHGAAAYLYVGYPGEPALGPPAFVHRASAMDDPDAPISHHWQDATHITWGVVTAGYSLRRWKLEASAFKGGEPDENRTNFDSPRLDSASARLSFNPGANWALQLSHGYLKHPEAAEPLLNRHRTTASVIYNRPLGANGLRGNWATTLVWGRNDDNNGVGTASYLLETNYQSGDNTWYTRLEHVRKAGAELALAAPDDTALFGVNSYAVGYVRELRHHKSMDMGLGAQLTIGSNDNGLDKYYGGGAHRGLQIFLRIRPARLKNG